MKQDDRTFVVALLGCGWPNNRTYKWADTKKLMQYGLENYEYRDIRTEQELRPVRVRNGIPNDDAIGMEAQVEVNVENPGKSQLPVLMKAGEKIVVQTKVKEVLDAPVKKGESIGCISYYLDGTLLDTCPVTAAESVEKITVWWCMKRVLQSYIEW